MIHSNPNFLTTGHSTSIMLIGILSIFLFQGCAASNNTRSDTAAAYVDDSMTPEYSDPGRQIIHTGDEIEIRVWDYEEFNTDRTVTREGMVTVPLVGDVRAQGLTRHEFIAGLEHELSEYIPGNINLSVNVTSTRSNMVSVLGSVSRPNNYEITENVSLFELLSIAGGTTDQADLRNITIYQQAGTGRRINVDLTRYLHGEDNPASLTNIYPGNIVYVPREQNVIREMSGFMRDVVLLFGMFRILN